MILVRSCVLLLNLAVVVGSGYYCPTTLQLGLKFFDISKE
jgi:hypothetical protein